MARVPVLREYSKMHEAVYFGKVDELNRLLAEGKIDVNAQTERKETPLLYAMCHNKVECIEPLIAHGANPNKGALDKWTPLHMGVMQKSYDALRKLIAVCKERCVSLNLNKGTALGETPLHYAACHRIPRAVEILVEAGANINVRSTTNDTPYTMALEHGHKAISTYLQKKGADLTKLPPPEGATIISLPRNISQGFLKDVNQMNLEVQLVALFGKTFWSLFSLKPKEGQTVEIAVNFKQPECHEGTFSWLRGIIHTVAEDKKMIIATVRLNCDHEGRIPTLEGEWEATLQLNCTNQFPWILTKLVLNTNPVHAYGVVRQVAKSLEAHRGKKYVIAKRKEHSCTYLKGTKHEHGDDHEAREIDGIDLRADGTVEMRFSDGETDSVDDLQKAIAWMRMVLSIVQEDHEVRRNVQLMFNGVPTSWEDYMQLMRTL